MQTQRMSLASIKNVLSRAEMRKIMAGSGPSCGLPACICVDDPCCYPAPGEGGVQLDRDVVPVITVGRMTKVVVDYANDCQLKQMMNIFDSRR